jgi:acetyltransferase-like isoleucine patch superfamily enzyme
MPLVDWPRWKDKHKKAFVGLAIFSIIAIIFGSLDLTHPHKALAAGGQLPTPAGQPGTFGGPGNSDPESLAITESTSPTTLIESPVTWVKLYFSPADGPSGAIQIFNMPYECDEYRAGGGWQLVTHGGGAGCTAPGIPDDTDNQVLYDFYNTDVNEQPVGAPIYTIDGQTGRDFSNPAITRAPGVVFGNWTGNINVPLGGTALSPITNFNVVLMRVRWGNCPAAVGADCQNPLVAPPNGMTTRLTSFRVQNTQPQDNIGYWAQNGASGSGAGATPPTFGSFTTHSNSRTLDHDIQNIEVDFAPPCTVISPQTAAIRWKNGDTSNVTNDPGHDGDQNVSNPNSNPWAPTGNDVANSFELFAVSPTGVRTRIELMPGGSALAKDQPGNPLAATGTNANGVGAIDNIGGFQDYRDVNFTAQPGYKYQWIWHDVNSYFDPRSAVPGNAHNLQMWIPYDSINYALNCGFNYHSSISATGATVPGGPNAASPAILNFSNPANYTNMTFQINASNTGVAAGPPAFVDPIIKVGSAVWTIGGPTTSWVTTSPVPGTNPNGIQPGQTIGVGTVSYSLNPATIPDGAIICFGSHIHPNQTVGDPGIDNDPPDQCYKVQNSFRYPSVIGTGDIHAGGGICGQPLQPPSAGFINGNPNSDSRSEYVTSASGAISDFGSNANSAASGADRLTLGGVGPKGQYAQVCRPDLFGLASANMPAGAVWTNVGGASLNLANPIPGQVNVTDSNGNAHVVAFIDGNIGIFGQLDHSLTLVVRTGVVSIDNDITRTGGTGRANVPGLGIISDKEVDIQCGCGSNRIIDAMIFSNDVIDTCLSGSFPSPPHCDNTLTVHGFLMAKTLRLHRLGPLDTSGAQPGEAIIGDPSLYLDPPYYFDDSSNSIFGLNGQGERQPLF